jgi:tetratricopeptide (TPR) repeat protein
MKQYFIISSYLVFLLFGIAEAGADEQAEAGADEQAEAGADEQAEAGADEQAESGADKQAEATKHFKIGNILLENGEFDAASEAFERSVKLNPDKDNLYNLAKCYEVTHRYTEALSLFERILNEFDDALDFEIHDEVSSRISALNASVARLKVESAPAGASIRIDGVTVGNSPLQEPLVLMPGDHKLEVSLEGYETVAHQVNLVAGAQKDVLITLQFSKATLSILSNEAGAAIWLNGRNIGVTPLAQPLLLDAGVYRVLLQKAGFGAAEEEINLSAGGENTVRIDLIANQPVQMAPVDPGQSTEISTAAHHDKKRKRSPVFWVGLAGTIAFGGVSAAMWGMSVSKLNDYEEKANEINANMNYWDFTQPEDDYEERVLREEANDLRKQVETLNKVAVGMTVATGAFAVMTILGLTVKKKDEKLSSARISPVPGGIEVRF